MGAISFIGTYVSIHVTVLTNR